jgi:hypothetical protein
MEDERIDLGGPLSIWQYFLLGGPPQSFSAKTKSIIRHRGNYIDISQIRFNRYHSRGNRNRYDNRRFPYSDVYPIEGDDNGVFFDMSFIVGSFRPSLLTLFTLFCIIAELGLAIMASLTYMINATDNPLIFTIYNGGLFLLFCALSACSVWFWAISSKYSGYIPLLTTNLIGMFFNGFSLITILFWIIQESTLVSDVQFDAADVSSIEDYIKFSVLNSVYFALVLVHISIYFFSVVSGYQKYVTNYSVVRTHIIKQKKKVMNLSSSSSSSLLPSTSSSIPLMDTENTSILINNNNNNNMDYINNDKNFRDYDRFLPVRSTVIENNDNIKIAAPSKPEFVKIIKKDPIPVTIVTKTHHHHHTSSRGGGGGGEGGQINPFENPFGE